MGSADVTVNTDGILIRKDKKEGIEDLIDEALKYNGQLPSNVTPISAGATPYPTAGAA